MGETTPVPEPPAVLVVEDDDGDFLLVRELLAEALPHSRVVRARSLEAALTRVARGLDCVLLDLGLPDSTGLGALRARTVRRACSTCSTGPGS